MKFEFTRRIKALPQQKQDGAVIPLLAVILVALVSIIALVIETSHKIIIRRELQNAVDAAALASTVALDGSKAGWVESKKAALEILQKSRLTGISEGLSKLAFNDFSKKEIKDIYTESIQCDSSKLRNSCEEDKQKILGDQGQIANLNFQIERGAYWADAEGKFRFVSLEGVDKQNNNHTRYFKHDVPAFAIANAVRIVAESKKIPGWFSRVFNSEDIGDITLDGIAVQDAAVDVPVLPFALPACQIMLDLDPKVQTGDHMADQYSPTLQCQRDLIITEVDPKSQTLKDRLPEWKQKRRDGLARFESYLRPPYYEFGEEERKQGQLCFDGDTPEGHFFNCKALPLFGVVGTPASIEANLSDEHVHAKLIRDILAPADPEKSMNSLRAKIGSRFHPLTAVKNIPGILEGKDKQIGDGANKENAEQFERRFATRLNNSNTTFKQVFGSLAQGDIQPNFPFLKMSTNANRDAGDLSYELRFLWPTNEGNQSLIVQNMQGGWTDPMCHSDFIPIDDIERAKVIPVNIMLIAPGREKDDFDRPIRYCDFENVFGGKHQESFAPIEQTEPIIVGFVRAYLFDFNIRDLDQMFEVPPAIAALSGPTDPKDYRVTPAYTDPVTRKTIKGLNPTFLGGAVGLNVKKKDFVKSINDYREKLEQWIDCVEKTETPCEILKPTPPVLEDIFPDKLFARCFRTNVSASISSVADNLSLSCKKKGGFSGFFKKTTSCNFSKVNPREALKTLDDLLEFKFPAIEHTHCIPILDYDRDCNDPSQPNCWQPPQPRYAGHGCGGFRVRLGCDPTDGGPGHGSFKRSLVPTLLPHE